MGVCVCVCRMSTIKEGLPAWGSMCVSVQDEHNKGGPACMRVYVCVRVCVVECLHV